MLSLGSIGFDFVMIKWFKSPASLSWKIVLTTVSKHRRCGYNALHSSETVYCWVLIVSLLGLSSFTNWSCDSSFSITYNDVIMSAIVSQITSLTIVCAAFYSGADQRIYQSSASLAFVRGIHRWPVNSPHKGPVTRKMFPFDDVIMLRWRSQTNSISVLFWHWRLSCIILTILYFGMIYWIVLIVLCLHSSSKTKDCINP